MGAHIYIAREDNVHTFYTAFRRRGVNNQEDHINQQSPCDLWCTLYPKPPRNIVYIFTCSISHFIIKYTKTLEKDY